jgi:LysR family glycine cleavage system transcriptional activator
MKRELPPLTWLRAFEASARHLSFTQAANELRLTQAAVSKQIKLLEQYLREPLFHRKPRSVMLTKAGEAYLPKVRDAFERLADGTAEVFGGKRSESLTVRVASGFAVNWLAPRISRFFATHPQTPVRIVLSVWNEPFDPDTIDLDIAYGTDGWQDCTAERLTWEALSPVCSPSLLESGRPLKVPADLRHHTLLHVLGYEEGWAMWLREAGVTDLNPGSGYQFDTSLMTFAVAAEGAGVALARTSMVTRELERGRLVRPFRLELPIDEAFYLLSPVRGGIHPDARKFRDWIIEEAQAFRRETAAA